MQSRPNTKQLTFKTILIGDSGIGKTALIQKYVTGQYRKECNVTVGVDFNSQVINVEGRVVQLQIWDTSGQDIYKSVTSSFYRGAAAVFLVYAVNNRDSFNHLEEWLDQFYEKGSKDAFIFLVGTKSDLPAEVSSEEAFQLMKSFEGAFCIQTSSKDGDSVRNLFQKAAESMYKLYTVSPQYRELVNRQRQTMMTKQSIKSSLTLQEMRVVDMAESRRRKTCC